MDLRLLILSLACLACLAPAHSELLLAKLLAKKAIGAGAAALAAKAALVKKLAFGGAAIAGAVQGSSATNEDCEPKPPSILENVQSLIETKKKIISDVIGKKQELIAELSKPKEVIIVDDVPQGQVFVDGPVEFPQLVEVPQFVGVPQLPPQFVNVVVEVPPRPGQPPRFFPVPPPPPFLNSDPIFPFPPPPPPPLAPIPIRNAEGDCL